jgi:saxitoxin biosynthesis operon SxtJ-like protein
MALIEKRSATRSDLKWFGLLMLAFFAFLGGMSQWRGHPRSALILWGIGAALALIYYVIPPTKRLMFDLWMGVTYPIGWVLSHLLMVIMFYLVITPIGLLMRLLGRDPMQRAFDRGATSYWVPREGPVASRRYFRQF